jgi:hypothetical protein
MVAIDDLEVSLKCSKFDDIKLNDPETVKFFMSCNDTSSKDANFPFGCNYKSLNTTSNAWDVISTKDLRFRCLTCFFLPPAYENCAPESFWNSVSIVNYVKHLYAVLWGCRNLTNNKHEQGAWILGYKNNFAEATKHLNQAFFVDLNFTKASIKDFVLHNQTRSEKATSCTYKVCKYNQLCKSDDQDDDEEK